MKHLGSIIQSFRRLHSISLKTKVTATVLLLFVVSIWLFAYIVTKRLGQDMIALLGKQQLSTASYIASDIDAQVIQRMELLNTVASMITSDFFADPAKARSFLNSRVGLKALFTSGLLLISKEGKGVADSPPAPGRAEAVYTEQDFFQEVVATGKPAIGKARRGRFINTPGLSFAVPIKERNGKLLGTLVGFTPLSDSTLFGSVEGTKMGDSGFIAIDDPKHRIIVTSSEPSRILFPMANPGVNKMVDKFVSGFEGTGIAVNSRGVETLTSGKRIPSTGWIVQMVLPTLEAYAPIRNIRTMTYGTAAVFTLFVLLALQFIINRLLKPLSKASQQIGEMSSGKIEFQPVPVVRNDEIGNLLLNFNLLVNERRLWERKLQQANDGLEQRVAQRTQELQRINEDLHKEITERKRIELELRQVTDRLTLAVRAGGVGIWDYNPVSNVLIWDDEMYRLYGITPDQFGGAYEAWRSGVHPEDRQRGDEEIQMALRGERDFDTEFRVLWSDGTTHNIRALAIVQRDDATGQPLHMIGTNWDVTAQKQAETELRESGLKRFRPFWPGPAAEQRRSLSLMRWPDIWPRTLMQTTSASTALKGTG